MPRRDLPPFRDLRSFMSHLEREGRMVRIREPVSVVHEMTEIHRRTLRANGPALLFEVVLNSPPDIVEFVFHERRWRLELMHLMGDGAVDKAKRWPVPCVEWILT